MNPSEGTRDSRPVVDLAGWLAVGSAGALGLALAARRIWAADFWWQWATGRFVAENGWPSGDPFSFTAAGGPWIELRWLFCWLQYRLMESIGPVGPSLLKILLIGGAFALVSLPVLRRGNRVWFGVVLAVALRAASPRFFVRPEWVSLSMIGLFVWILHRFRRTGSRWIYLLPLLQIVWVNSHPLFLFGPLLCGLMGLTLLFDTWMGRSGMLRSNWKERVLPLVVSGVGCIAACWVNPYGTAGAGLPLLLFSEVRDSVFRLAITELQSPFGGSGGIGALFSFKLLIVMAVVSVFLNLRRLDPFWTLFAASQFYLASLSVRSIPLFCLAAVPLIVYNVDRLGWASPKDKPWYPRARMAVAGVLALACLVQIWDLATDRFYVRRNDSNQFGLGLATGRYPIDAARTLEGQDAPERVLGGLLESSYLLAHGKKVYADPRLEVYGEEIFSEYLRALTDRDAFDAAVREHGIGAVMIEPGSPAVGFLNGRPGWALLHLDPVATVYVHRAGGVELRGMDAAAHQAVIDGLLEEVRRIPGWGEAGWFGRVYSPKPALVLADHCFRLQDAECSGAFLDQAERISPYVAGLADKRSALASLARSAAAPGGAAQRQVRQALERLAAGDPVGAEELAQGVTREFPQMPEGWALLGRLLAERGMFPQAADAFTKAIRLAPREAAYRVALARILASLGYREQAIQGMDIALQLEPNNVGILQGLAALTLSAGDLNAARGYIERALEIRPEDPQLLEIKAAIDAAP